MSKRSTLLVLVAILLVAVLGLTACGEEELPVTYEVTLTDGASTNTYTVQEGTLFTLPTLQQSGMAFEGWLSGNETVTGVVEINADTTFTAQWTKATVTVSYNVPQGVTAPQSVESSDGLSIVLPDGAQAAGHTFVWNVDGKLYMPGESVVVKGTDGAMTITGEFKQNVTAIFNVDGQEVASAESFVGSTFVTADQPELPNGVIFKGWSCDGEVYAAGETLDAEAGIVFEAVTAKAYPVTFYAEDGKTIVDLQWVEEGANAVEPAYEYPAQYGWYEEFKGLTAMEAISAPTAVYPVYEYVPSDLALMKFTEIEQNGQTVAYAVSKADSLQSVTDLYPEVLKLPKEYNGLPVVAVYSSVTSTSYSATNIKKSGFSTNTTTTKVVVPNTYVEFMYGSFADCSALAEVEFEEGSNLETIGALAFAYAPFAQIEIPQSVTYIGKLAFVGCGNLASVTFEEGDKPLTFEDEAFAVERSTPNATTYPYECSLASFTFPARTSYIGARVFKYNMTLETLAFEEGNTPLIVGDNAFNASTSTFSANLTASLTKAYPFKVTEINFPARTAYIGAGAYAGQIWLEELSFTEGCMLQTTGVASFAHTLSLTSISFPTGLKEIGNSTFATAGNTITYYSEESPATLITPTEGFGFKGTGSAFTTLTIPNTVEVIGPYAFAGATSLKTLKLTSDSKNDHLKTIGKNAFYCNSSFCSNAVLRSITWSTSIEVIDDNNFFGYTNLGTINLNSLTKLRWIGDHAFELRAEATAESSAITVTFPASNLAYIGTDAFLNRKINKITFTDGAAVPMTIADGAFSGEWTSGGGIEGAIAASTFASDGVTIPAYITSIDSTAFRYITDFGGFTVDSANPNYYSYDGVLYAKGVKGLEVYNVPFNKTEFKMAEGCTRIAPYAFDVTSLTAFDFTDIEYIGDYAFRASALKEINIPDTVTEMGQRAFENGVAVKVTFNAPVLTNGSFGYQYSMEEIHVGENVKTIETNAIANLMKLEGGKWLQPALTNVYFEGTVLKEITGKPFNSVGDIFRIVVDADLVDIYKEDANLSNVKDLITTATTVTFEGAAEGGTVEVGLGAPVPANKIPEAGEGFVWAAQQADGTYLTPANGVAENAVFTKTDATTVVTLTFTGVYMADGTYVREKSTTMMLAKGAALPEGFEAPVHYMTKQTSNAWEFCIWTNADGVALENIAAFDTDMVFTGQKAVEVTIKYNDTEEKYYVVAGQQFTLPESVVVSGGNWFVVTSGAVTETVYDFAQAVNANLTIQYVVPAAVEG